MNKKYKKAWEKEYDRIRKAIARAEKRGYIVPESLKPKRPKIYTKRGVERLKTKLSTENLYKRMQYADRDTGEIISGEAARAIERRESAKKAAATRKMRKAVPVISVYDTVREAIENLKTEVRRDYDYETMQDILLSIMDRRMEEDEAGYETYLTTVYADIQSGVEAVTYASDQAVIEYLLTRLARALNGGYIDVESDSRLDEISELMSEWGEI